MKNYNLIQFKASALSYDKLKMIQGGVDETLEGADGCSASAKCISKTISCTGVNTCSGTDYDRVVCDGKIENCPECGG